MQLIKLLFEYRNDVIKHGRCVASDNLYYKLKGEYSHESVTDLLEIIGGSFDDKGSFLVDGKSVAVSMKHPQLNSHKLI